MHYIVSAAGTLRIFVLVLFDMFRLMSDQMRIDIQRKFANFGDLFVNLWQLTLPFPSLYLATMWRNI